MTPMNIVQSPTRSSPGQTRPDASAPSPERATPRLQARWARDEDDVRAAQQLRWQVFAEEMGARLRTPLGTPPGVDADRFDPHCEHLLVCTEATDREPSTVVGTYRVLTAAAALRLGGLYADLEFDLVRLGRLRPQLAELGRSCIAPAWRTGGVILMLWSELGAFMHRNGIPRVLGCASVSMRDGGRMAADLWNDLRHTHLAAADEQVQPRCPLPVEHLATGARVDPPALIKGYLRCGGRVLGPPAWDPDFGTADLPMMLKLDDLPTAYRRRFLGV